MLERILGAINGSVNDNLSDTRRRFPRRVSDTCVVEIADKTYPIKDWSQCGVLIQMDSRAYHAGQKLSMMLKFRTETTIEEIPVQAEIVRKSENLIAFNFINLSAQSKAHFTKIIDEAIAKDFDNSQMA